MTFTTNSSGSTVQINTRNQIRSNATNDPNIAAVQPIRYQDIWSTIVSYAYP